MENKPIIIFDTDMDTDCDDAGALLMLINAHLRGDASLLGEFVTVQTYMENNILKAKIKEI